MKTIVKQGLHVQRLQNLERGLKTLLPLVQEAWQEEKTLNKVRRIGVPKEIVIQRVVAKNLRAIFSDFSTKTLSDYERYLIEKLLLEVN